MQEAIALEMKPIYILLRGFQHYYSTDLEEAIKNFNMCIDIDPEFTEAYFYITKVMLEMLDLPEFYNRIRAAPTNDDPFAVND